MFLFIFESIGTSELILVGIVALIFLGPRKLPEMAKKAGKIMSEFRGTANEFKQTWEREVNFEDEVKSLSLSNLDDPADDAPSPVGPATTLPNVPVVKAADPDAFKHLISQSADGDTMSDSTSNAEKIKLDDKKNWL